MVLFGSLMFGQIRNMGGNLEAVAFTHGNKVKLYALAEQLQCRHLTFSRTATLKTRLCILLDATTLSKAWNEKCGL